MMSSRTLTHLYVCAVYVNGVCIDVYAANSLELVAKLAKGHGSEAVYRFNRA